MITKRIHFLKGEYPEPMSCEWWSEEDWKKYYDKVEELKRTGEYLKPDYVDISYNPDDFKMFQLPQIDPEKPWFSNLGIIIPNEDGTVTDIKL